MTARDLAVSLQALGVRMRPEADGRITYQAKHGVLTLVLQGVLKTCRQPLWVLLTGGEDTALPTGVSVPVTDYRQFRTWVTGKAPAGYTLKAPTVHDVPSEPRTYLSKPCPTQKCAPTDTFKNGNPASRYFAPSGICVACWNKCDKHTKPPEELEAERQKKKRKWARD